MDIKTSFGRSHDRVSNKYDYRYPVKPSERGLSDAEAERSRELYGKNRFTEKKKRSFAAEFFKNLSDPIIRVLLIALAVNIIFTIGKVNWVEIGGIAATVFIAATVSTLSEFSSGSAYKKLFGEANLRQYPVWRNGTKVTLNNTDIVCHDTVEIDTGDIVPCDGYLIGGSVTCDESSLTGESKSIKKSPVSLLALRDEALADASNHGSFLYSGSTIVSGSGTLVCTAVGDNTAYGTLAAEIQCDEGTSPLKERLTKLAKIISRLGYIGAVIVAIAYLFNTLVISSGFDLGVILSKIRNTRLMASEIIHALSIAISIVVVAVPEGLPMMITVVLSANMKKMMRSGVLVRKLVGIETAGSLSILFTDKTGTVTTGNMKVVSVSTAFDKDILPSRLSDYGFLLREITLANDCCSGRSGGNLTDRALTKLSSRKHEKYALLEHIPFDSAYKYSAALITDGNKRKTIIRGAPEVILPMCSSYIDSSGNLCKGDIKDHTSRLGSLRMICHAIGSEDDFVRLKSGLSSSDMIYVCTYSLKDEVRSSVPSAVRSCAEAGVQVVMLTGDSESTAASVAVDAGILPKEYSVYGENTRDNKMLVLRSEHLHMMSDNTLSSILPRIAVISRSTPADKSRLVRIAKGHGHVVGMTGDGVNDAPALKAADVGFAMGSGTDAAREAADIVITDNNFASITKAVHYGRTIFESIRRFILFQLIMNLCAVGVSLIAPFLGIENPITITQMLWINIIMDTLGSLAFAGEAPLKSYMKRPPIKRDEPILDKTTVRRILFSGIYTLLLSLVFLCSEAVSAHYDNETQLYRLTVFFALFIFCGIANAFCARSSRINLLAGLWKSRAFILIMSATSFTQLIIIYFGGSIFRTVPLTSGDLFFAAIASLTVLPADMICKILLSARRKTKNINQ